MVDETTKIIKERDAFWVGEMEKRKDELSSKIVGAMSSPNMHSQEASCSESMGGRAEQDAVKKRLNLGTEIEEKKTDEFFYVGKQNEYVDVDKNEKLVEVDNLNEFIVVKNKSKEVKTTNLISSERQLALGCLSNIVALALVDEVPAVEGREQTLHGIVLTKDNARVMITHPIQADAKISFPIQDEIVTMGQALGTYIAWPREFTLDDDDKPAMKINSKRGKKLVKKSRNVIQNIDESDCEFILEMAKDYPSALKHLWIWANDALFNGRTVCFPLCQDAFGSNDKKYVFLQEVHALCSRGEMSGSIISRFINNHWALTVVNPHAGVVYHMDPLKRRIATGEWVEVVDNGIKLYWENIKKVDKKKIVWENMAGVPVQSGSKDCGLFMMLYMKEICENKELDFHVKWSRRTNLVYSEDDINGVRIGLAKFFMKHHAH